MLKVYNLSDPTEKCEEKNCFIVNDDKVIMTNDEAVHSIYNLEDQFLNWTEFTVKEFMEKYSPIEEVELKSFVRKFGNRIERNYDMLLKSIEEIGLNSKEFKR
jgi:deoxyhypusine synthase